MNENERDEARRLVYRLIELIGDDPKRPGLKKTPERVVRSWSELYLGYSEDETTHVTTFDESFDELIMLRNIAYFSTCEHHLLPFYGKAHVAYIPSEHGKVLGASKMARIVNTFARRLQLQERMTRQIADAVQNAVKAKGIAVIVDGIHLCYIARGARQHEAELRTSCLLGVCRDEPQARAEVLGLLRGGQ